MKKFLLYIVSAIMFAACSSEQIELAEQTNEKTPNATPNTNGEEEAWPWGEGVSATVPNLELHGDQEPTRALVYDNDVRFMKFYWNGSAAEDMIGVFPVNSDPTKSSQQCFERIAEESSTGIGNASANFKTKDGGVKTVSESTEYVSYYPFIEGELNYVQIPITYLGQKQRENLNIKAYATRKNSDELMNAYKQSELAAAEHLEEFDYLVSSAGSTPTGDIHFSYTRLGSTVRLFIKAPEQIVYDSIQLVNKDVEFMTKGTMNVPAKTLTATKTSHAISLQLGNNGFDLSDNTSNDYQNPTTGYIVAYMMLAPIQLDKTDISQCYLYMCGHVKDHPKQKKYFKSAPLTKYDIEQNKTLQWTTTNNTPDEPITFNAISVEEWKEGTTFSNGDDGKGTEGW